MKRLIFSVYTDKLDPHSSASEYKKEQFRIYRDRIIQIQQGYAFYCNADYVLQTANISDYNLLQFEKLAFFQRAAERYDEVLYIDFDVLPMTKLNFFNKFDLNSICAYSFGRDMNKKDLLEAAKWNQFDPMNIYAKTCCKNAMLLMHDVIGNNELINTGVLGGNKNSIAKLNFLDNLDEMHETFHQALEDNIYPENITDNWFPNNEAFISYLIEKNEVPFTNIGLQWNFILDKFCPRITSACHFVHHVNKEFELSFNDVV